MGSARTKAKLVRLWQLIELLRGRKHGLTPRQILEQYGGSKSTLYRDLDLLREIGVPFETKNVNGETRYRLGGYDLPPLGPSALQIAALRLARRRSWASKARAPRLSSTSSSTATRARPATPVK